MQHRSTRPGRGCRASGSPPREVPSTPLRIGRPPIGQGCESHRSGRPARGVSARVEYLIRPARVTDIERLVALSGGSLRSSGGSGPLNSGDLLRQLVYLPQASIFIAESRREVVGGAVLALRPSVRAGGFVGAVDLIVVDPDHDHGARHRRAAGGDPPLGTQQGLHRRRGGPLGRPGGADPPGTSRFRRIRSAR